jgi:Subtilase family
MPTPPGSLRKYFRLALAALLLAGAVGLGLSLRGSSGERQSGAANDWAGLAGSARSNVSVGERVIVVLRAQSLADHVAAAGGLASDEQERDWSAQAVSDQKTIIAKLALRGVSIDPEFSFTRVINGFSVALDYGSIAVLERSPEVRGIYPVRVTYPTSIDVESLGNPAALVRGYHTQVTLSPYDGRGVTIALLDTGVDRLHEYLRGHVQSGIDIVGNDPEASAAPNPDNRSELEHHGTQLAGIIVGPAALGGVAPGASILPIRVAGWQRDTSGAYQVYGRTDQFIAGLERAVDPNDDGDAHDAARIALVGVSAPLAGFADGPEARAVSGAAALDTLVVAPAGNDGSSGQVQSTIGSPGGASDALTVGALDLRQKSERVRVVVRSGLEVLFDGAVSLGGSAAPKTTLSKALASPPVVETTAGGLNAAPDLSSFFDRKGYSLVAGKAALVPAGDDPRGGARNAGLAGASAVVLYGTSLPSGALGLDENVNVPVVSVPARVGKEVSARLSKEENVEVSIGKPFTVSNPDTGKIAPFSSQGLTFSGEIKPNLVAPGVGIATADAGTTAEGFPAFATVSGSSAAAAVVAGAAALLTQARPDLSELELRSLLTTSARPLRRYSLTVQGAGALDLTAAARASLALQSQSLVFPLMRGARKQATLGLALRNLAASKLGVAVSASCEDNPDWVRIRVSPRRLLIGARGRKTVKLRVDLTGRVRGSSAQGTVKLLLSDGRVLRVPWSFRYAAGGSDLISQASLSGRSFSSSDSTAEVLTLGLGRVSGTWERRIEPAVKVEVGLWNDEDRFLGVLARMRDVLPGRYVFGLTGRNPAGATLASGDYRLRITVFPSGGGKASVRSLHFTIEPAKKTETTTTTHG